MKVRFLTSVAGMNFSYDYEEVVDLPDAVARDFIRAKQAIAVEEAVKDSRETAMMGRSRSRGR